MHVPMTSRSILHVIEDLKPESGGPTTVVVELARHQVRSGARVSVVCGSGPDQASQRAQLQASFEADGVALHVLASADRAPSRRRLRELIQTTGAEVVHLHGMWSSIVRLGAAEARRAGLTYVISTHGMLHPDVLEQGKWKKRLYLTVFASILGHCGEVLALNDEERHAIHTRFHRPASVLPNGLEIKRYIASSSERFRGLHPELANTSFALFVGRLHPIKGIDQLLRSFIAARERGLCSHLVVAGPDGGQRAELERQVSEARLSSVVHFIGPVYGDVKIAAFQACSMFVHRPRFEGFGLTVLEALAAGKPVVTTRRCRLDGAESADALRVTPDTDEGFAEAMVALERDPASAAELGARAQAWVQARFDWSAIAQQALEVYNRVLGRG